MFVNLVAKETGFVPMLLLVGEVFGVDANDLSTLVAVVGKDVLVTLQKLAVSWVHTSRADSHDVFTLMQYG